MKNYLKISALSLLISSNAYAIPTHDHKSHSDGNKRFYGHLDVKILSDKIIASEESAEEFNEYYAHSHLDLGARINKNLSVNTQIKLEGHPLGHSHGGTASRTANGKNQYFENHPLFVEKLTVDYNNENYDFYIGKFNPIVGITQHDLPGIYGYQIIEDYEIRGKVGFGGAIKFDAKEYGKHQLDASTFFEDTTLLSESALYQRGNTSKEDGGLSNTENLSSFALSLSGHNFLIDDFSLLDSLSYRFGYAKQAAGIDDESDETRYSLALAYDIKLSDNLNSRIIAEQMNIDRLNGEIGHDRILNTVGLKLDYKQWNLGASYTYINNDAVEEDENYDGSTFQASFGYNFKNGFGIHLGYRYDDEENEVTERVGTAISYSKSF